ncbi:MAG: hypothetical protein N2D54_04000 [Chloroflexota bacterium]
MLILTLTSCASQPQPTPTLVISPPTSTIAPTEIPATQTPDPSPTVLPSPTAVPTLVIPATPDMSNATIYGGAHVGATTFNITLVSIPPGLPERFIVFVNFTEYKCENLEGQSEWWLYCSGKTPPVGATVSVQVFLRPETAANPSTTQILLFEGETTIPAYTP